MTRDQRDTWIARAAARVDETDGAACALFALALAACDLVDLVDGLEHALSIIARNLDDPGVTQP